MTTFEWDEFSIGILVTIVAGLFMIYLVFSSKQQSKELQRIYGSTNAPKAAKKTNYKNVSKVEPLKSKLDPKITSKAILNDEFKESEFDINYGLNLISMVQLKHNISLPPKLVLVTDLDHTLFGVGEEETQEEVDEYIEKFNELWLNKYALNNSLLIYATGRSLTKYLLGVKQYSSLMKPDILICKDGVDIYWFNETLYNLSNNIQINALNESNIINNKFIKKDLKWENHLKEGWNQEFAEQIQKEWISKNRLVSELPKGSELVEPFRIALFCYNREDAISGNKYFEERVKEYNKNKSSNDKMNIHTFYCIEKGTKYWWSAMTAGNAGKGLAVDFVRKELKCKNGNNFIICGDSGNDISMISLPKYNGVIVSNSSSDLKEYYNKNVNTNKKGYLYLTNAMRTNGVIEGLEHWSKQLRSWELIEKEDSDSETNN